LEDIDEPELPERDPELEALIRELIAAKYAAEKGSAEYLMVMRQLAGLRYTRELAGPIMEDLDPFGWGAMCQSPGAPDPEGKVLPLQPPRRRQRHRGRCSATPQARLHAGCLTHSNRPRRSRLVI
jgi:hypothetical protein